MALFKKKDAHEKTEKKKKLRAKFYVDKKSWLVKVCIALMVISSIARLAGTIGMWKDTSFAITQIVLPLACSVVFVAFLLLFGNKALWPTALPVLFGVAFFIIKSFGFESWLHTVLCIGLYLLVLVLYSGTVFGVICTKWLLVPLFALPFLYHIFVEDIAILKDTANPATFAWGMQEFSVLCIMLSLLFLALAMKKRKPPVEKTEAPAENKPAGTEAEG